MTDIGQVGPTNGLGAAHAAGRIHEATAAYRAVEAIKQAIREGTYPLDSRRIAQSFASMEKLIG